MDVNLPINREAEEIVLGRMMNSIDTANDALESLQTNDFFFPDHQAVFDAMRALARKEAVIEANSVYLQWKESSDKADPALPYGLAVHTNAYTNDITQFMDLVKKCSIARKLIAHSKEAIVKASSQEFTPEELHGQMNEAMELIFNDEKADSLHHVGSSYAKEYMDSGLSFMDYLEKKIQDRKAGICTLSGYPSGYCNLDNILDGFNKGHLLIVGARPGVGKTTFILNLIERMCIHKQIKVGFFSLEASLQQVMMNFICLTAHVETNKAKRGYLNPLEYERLMNAKRLIEDKPFFLDEKGSLRLSQVISRCKRMVRNHGIEVLFIDYIGEVRGDGKYPNKQEEMQTVSRGLRGLAKSMNIPIILVAQLNRESEKGNRVPIKSDLRESGQIEADAHSILMLHRPDQEDQYNKPGILNVHIVKNRYGAESAVSFNFHKESGQLEELADFVNPSRQQENSSEDDKFK